MYDVVAYNAINYEDASRDLNLNLDHVRSYFMNYDLYKTYPIRDLTFEEEKLVKAISQVKIMSDSQLTHIINEYNIKIEDMVHDPLLIERKIARYDDEVAYSITRKYQHFILEPAVLYGNIEAPLTRPLSMDEILISLSNIGVGKSRKGEPIDARTRISALTKVADIYISTKILTQKSGGIDDNVKEDLSPEELTNLIDFIKSNHAIPGNEVNLQNATKPPTIVEEETNHEDDVVIVKQVLFS